MPPIDPPKAQHQLSGSETAFFAYQMAHLCFPDACRSFPGGLHCTWPFPFLETAVGLGQKTLQNRKIDLSELQILPDCPFLTTVASASTWGSFWTLDGRKRPKESHMVLILVPSMGPVCGIEGKGGGRGFQVWCCKVAFKVWRGALGLIFMLPNQASGRDRPCACLHVCMCMCHFWIRHP